jgi:hypothetical protein
MNMHDLLLAVQSAELPPNSTATPIQTMPTPILGTSSVFSQHSADTSAMFSAAQNQIIDGVVCYLPRQHEIDSTLYIDDDLHRGAFNHPVIVLSLGTDGD